jgi:hypothetical protein
VTTLFSSSRYNVDNAKFPYDPEEKLVDVDGEEMYFVKYYRFIAADICATAIATAIAIGEVPERSPGEKQVDESRKLVKAGGGQKNNASGTSLVKNMNATSNTSRSSFSAKKFQNMAQYDSQRDTKLNDQHKEEETISAMTRIRLSLKDYLNGSGKSVCCCCCCCCCCLQMIWISLTQRVFFSLF